MIGNLEIVDPKGDTKVIWDSENEDEVKAAEELFNSLRKKGHLAYAVVGEKGEKGEVIKKFDPELERIILAPAMAGG
jgi:hypothetical protein